MEKDVLICRCKEVTEQEILAAIADGATTVTGVKRRTGAGMGLCQGRTCRRMVTSIIARQTGAGVGDMEMETARPPVRPVKMGTLLEEPPCRCKGE
ncbi:MAG: (2Fe-2S)-binding protein [Negativicutes bacterium]|nr:(2Fe-2S)-binding protein [Negativicutes bacterium]